MTFYLWPREDWLIYFKEEQSSCGRMIRLQAHPLPLLSRQKIVFNSRSSYVSQVQFTDGEEGEGVEPNDTERKKTWASTQRSILSGWACQ